MGVVRFGAFSLDRSRRAILRDGTEIELRSQSFDVLNCLARNAGRVVSKDELIEAVWPTNKPANEEDSLVQCITDIRRALGDGDRRIIKTFPRKGYMFAAELSGAAPGTVEAPRAAPGAVPDRRSDGAVEPQAVWQRGLIAAVLLVAILAGSGWLTWNWLRPAELTMTAAPSLVVLPVKPLGDQADTALATLADEIAAALLRATRGFDPVIQPSSAVRDAQDDPKLIGRNLGVRYLVRNLARRESEQVHVTVQLIEAQSARHVWARDFAYRPGEPKAQSRLAARIGQTLAAEILRTEVRRPLPARLEAGHLVMLGRKRMTDEETAKANAEAIAYFEKALAADPKHFLALVHYARATARHRIIGWMRESEAGQKERVARAEEAIELALVIDRSYPFAHLTRGNVLRAKSEHGRAIGAIERALELEEYFFAARAELARTLIDVGRAEEAIPILKEAIDATPTADISPHFWYYWLGLAALHLPDRNADALAWFAKSHDYEPKHDNTFRLWAVALADANRWEEADEKAQEFLRLRRNATLDDWKVPNARFPPAVARVRKHIRDTLKRLGVPEGKMKAASTP